MAKVSRTTAENVNDFGVAEDRTTTADGYTMGFTTIREAHDLAPALAGLPGGQCACPHWGYVTKGRLVFTFSDREEMYEAGDAFYTPPGHTPAADADTEFVMFSPADLLEATEAAIVESMQNG
ncbi:MAG TPA: cupin domain-containing protein [Acidimicrobiia bacterium]|nr:cupin domain-containing protein [Acidimicrobiia bacterium]